MPPPTCWRRARNCYRCVKGEYTGHERKQGLLIKLRRPSQKQRRGMMGIVARMLNALETERLKYLRRAKSRNPYTEGIEAGLSIAQGIVKQEAKQQASPLSRLDRGIGGEGMNKEEQIQGMAEFLEAQCAFETWADNERCAQAFYAAGYRKVTKLKVLTSERTDRKVPRVASNPYGDNTIGMAFDEGWWAAMRVVKERWTELRK